MRLFFYKIKHWEFWPTWFVYTPVFFAYLYYSLRAKDFYYIFNTNPGFKNGGFINTSKKEIYDLIPTQYYPKTILINANDLVKNNSLITQFKFPLIVKPDKGLRGIMVKKIYNQLELETYNTTIKSSYLIQELIQLEKEIGIFYTRHPKFNNGTITGIVEKEFFTIIGDGISTIEELIRANKRHELQLKTLKKELIINFKKVLPIGKKEILVPFGNHNRGTLFLDASHKITPKLTQTIDAICKQITGFNYGRLDLKFNSWADLEQGKNMSIIEINGALSEPAHVYDPKYNFFWGLSEIMRHQKIMFNIAKYNNSLEKSKMNFTTVIKELKTHFNEVSKLTN
jgi:hypothetical protein